MQLARFLRLRMIPDDARTPAEQQEFERLDRLDERMGDRLVCWYIPGLLIVGGLAHALLSWLTSG